MDGFFADVGGILCVLLRITPQGDAIVWTGSSECRIPSGKWLLFSEDDMTAMGSEVLA